MSVNDVTVEKWSNDNKGQGGFPLLESPWLWLALVFVLQLASPYVPLSNRSAAMVAFILTTAAYVVGVVRFIALGTAWKMKPAVTAAGVVLLGLGWWLLDKHGMAAAAAPLVAAAKANRPPDPGSIFLWQLVRVTADAALLGASVMGGSLVARLIKSPNMLGPICAVVALIDIWGVLFAGPVSQIMEKAPDVAKKAMPSLPAAGALAKGAEYAIQPLQIGVGDYLFLGLLFAALHYNNMNWRGALRLAIPFIFVTLMLVPFVGHMPGLLPIGLAIALPNLKYFEFTRDEKFALLWAGVFVLVLSAGAYFAVLKALPEKKPTAKLTKVRP